MPDTDTDPGRATSPVYQDVLEHLTGLIVNTTAEELTSSPVAAIGILNNMVGWLQAKAER